MLRDNYLRHCLNASRYLERGWLLGVMGILPKTTDHYIFDDFKLRTVDGVMEVEVDGRIEKIDDYIAGLPLYDLFGEVTIDPSFLKCVKGKTVTTYGLVILNALMIEYPFGHIGVYKNELLNSKQLDAYAYNLLNTKQSSVEQHIKYEEAANMLMCLSTVGVPSATKRMWMDNPLMKETKEKLLAQYTKEELTIDTLAEIQKKLKAVDDDFLLGDASTRFLIGGKAGISRQITKGIMGATVDFTDTTKVKIITNSLTEGWTVDDIPELSNSIIGGSYMRGANTALAGAVVKEVARIFQDWRIVAADCKTDEGMVVPITEINYNLYIEKYELKTNRLLTEDILKHSIGKTLHIRSPAYCDSTGTTVCQLCCGKTMIDSGVGIPVHVMEVTNALLTIFLKISHGSVLSTAKYNYLERLT